jgi:hypothetical protein
VEIIGVFVAGIIIGLLASSSPPATETTSRSGGLRTRDENACRRLMRPLTLDRGQGCGYIS